MNWRVATVVLSALCGVLAIALVRASAGVAPQETNAPQVVGPLLVAQLTTQDKPPTAVAFDVAAGKLRISHSSLGDGGRAATLWLTAQDGKSYPLGIIWNGEGGTAIILSTADKKRMHSGARLQVSLEPDGQTPAQPSSPIIATGTLLGV